jgi:hypothetical protein
MASRSVKYSCTVLFALLLFAKASATAALMLIDTVVKSLKWKIVVSCLSMWYVGNNIPKTILVVESGGIT